MPPSGNSRLPFIALLGANAVSLIGTMLTAIALPWYVLETTGSAGKTGLTAFAVLLPGFAGGLLGGTFVDRLGSRRASIIADLVSCTGIAAIPLLHATVGLPFPVLLVFVFLGTALEIPGLTARRAMLPELAEHGGLRLEQVNAAFETNQYLSLLLGPPLAGLLIAWLGATQVLWLDAASFAVSAIVVLVAISARLLAPVRASGGNYRQEFVAGLRFLWDDRLLRALALCLALTNTLGNPLVAVVLPVLAAREYESAAPLGWLVAAFGIGSLAGGVLYGAITYRVSRRALWLLGFGFGALPYWALASATPLPVLFGTLILSGLIGGGLNPLLVTIRHERIPAVLRGRVFGSFSAITQVAAPLGVLVAGVLIEGLGFTPTLLGLAIAYQCVAVALIFAPALREMDRRPLNSADRPPVRPTRATPPRR